MRPQTIAAYSRSNCRRLLLLLLLFVALFGRVAVKWARDCWELDDFSHCLLIPVICGVLVYKKRHELGHTERTGGRLGLVVLLGSLGVFFYGFACSFNVFERLGAYGSLIGLISFNFGDRPIRSHPFPFLYLALAIPAPFVYYSKISIALREFVTGISASVLQLLQIPAVNDGSVLHVGDLSLGVVDACSGIRSVMAVFAVAVLAAYIFRSGVPGGVLLVSLTVPIAVLLNVFRVIVMTYALYSFGVDLTAGVFHEALGLLIFVLILVLMYLSWGFIRWLLRIEPRALEEPRAAQ